MVRSILLVRRRQADSRSRERSYRSLSEIPNPCYFFSRTPPGLSPTAIKLGIILNRMTRPLGALLTLFCVIVFANLGRVSVFRGIAEHWFVLVPIGAVLGLYALVHIEGRYIAAYVVVLWMVLFRSVAIPHSEESKRIFTAILTSAAADCRNYIGYRRQGEQCSMRHAIS